MTVGGDGTMLEDGDGWATWQVTAEPSMFELADLSWSDLVAGAPPVEVEARMFQNSAEYSSDRGTIRLATDVEFTGPIPIFTELEAGLPAGGELTGNDLRVTIDTGTEELTGSMLVELSAQGIRVRESSRVRPI